MKNTKRRRACDCVHYFESSYDGSKMCAMFTSLNLNGEEVRVRMMGDCNGVCDDWKEDRKEGAKE